MLQAYKFRAYPTHEQK
ncbi:helix-turn-helix domain-containing protein, partial [Parathermosynechococcus lividus]